MSLAKDLRSARLRQVHASLLKRSDDWSSVNHIAVRSDYANIQKLLSSPEDDPVYLEFPRFSFSSHEESECPRDSAEPTPSREKVSLWARCTEVFVRHQCASRLWEANWYAYLSHDVLELRVGSEQWYGRFVEGSGGLLEGEEEYPIQHFAQLARQVVDDFVGRPREYPRWLELLHTLHSENREEFYCEAPESSLVLTVTWLLWNIFLTSAKAIELLLDNPNHLRLLSSPSEIRPAYERDHLWLEWSTEEGLTPAKIRDRWDAMSDAERQTCCPGAYNKIGDVGKKAGRQIVVTALKKARGEQEPKKYP